MTTLTAPKTTPQNEPAKSPLYRFITDCAAAAHHGNGAKFIGTDLTAGQVRGRVPWPRTFTLTHRRGDRTITFRIRTASCREAYMRIIAASNASRTVGNPLQEVLILD